MSARFPSAFQLRRFQAATEGIVNAGVPHVRPTPTDAERGVTLLEVLVAIFVNGVGLLALLTLFPLGALEMAAAIKDDRAGVIAAEAARFSQAGEKVVLDTVDFAHESWLTGAVDPQRARALADELDQLTAQALAIELQIDDLESALPSPQVQRYTAPLETEIRAIARRIRRIVRLIDLGLGQPNPSDQ
jgi:Tfp pilus assembly protein PilV